MLRISGVTVPEKKPAAVALTAIYGIGRSKAVRILREASVDPMKRAEALTADECFFTGTAAEVTPIASIDDRPMKSAPGPATKRIAEEFKKITRGDNPKYLDWLRFVK